MKISARQSELLALIERWGENGVYMPFQSQIKTVRACERKGLIEYKSVSNGSPKNGYSLTAKGRELL